MNFLHVVWETLEGLQKLQGSEKFINLDLRVLNDCVGILFTRTAEEFDFSRFFEWFSVFLLISIAEL